MIIHSIDNHFMLYAYRLHRTHNCQDCLDTGSESGLSYHEEEGRLMLPQCHGLIHGSTNDIYNSDNFLISTFQRPCTTKFQYNQLMA
jgi:hypothetical protein